MFLAKVVGCVASCALIGNAVCPAQTAGTNSPASAKPQRGGPRQPVPDDTAGFQSIFNGKTLAGWDGDATFWRVENGEIVGESTAEKALKQNTFIIWSGTARDFELKLEFKLTGGNSGVQYRSGPVPEAGKHVLRGYQADMDAKDMYTGMLYEERARGFLAERGRMTRIVDGGERKLIGSPGDTEELKAAIKNQDWNHLHIIARGNTLIHVINGRVMSVCIDEDPKGRPSTDASLGLQLHAGPPMKVEFRNIVLKKL